MSRRGALASLRARRDGERDRERRPARRQAADRALAAARRRSRSTSRCLRRESTTTCAAIRSRSSGRATTGVLDRQLDAAGRADLDRRRGALGARARARRAAVDPLRAGTTHPLARLGRFDRRLQRAPRLAGRRDARAGRLDDRALPGRAPHPRAGALPRRLPRRPRRASPRRSRSAPLGVAPRAAVLGVALLGGGGRAARRLRCSRRDSRWRSRSTALFAFLFAVMWAEPAWNALAVIGPHPDGGGRFYGVTNEVETLLLPPALVLGALAGVRPAAGGRAGARRRDRGEPDRCRRRRAASSTSPASSSSGCACAGCRARRARRGRGAVAAGAALLLVGHRRRHRRLEPRHEGGRRRAGLRRSATSATACISPAASIASTWNNALLFALGIVALVVLALQRPRSALLDACLVALAVSLLVNDTPTDVAGVRRLRRARPLAADEKRRGPRTASVDSRRCAASPRFSLLAFLLAGCGRGSRP